MKRITFLLMMTVGLAYAGQGYWDCTKAHGKCTYMKYDKNLKHFREAKTFPQNEKVYTHPITFER